MRGEDPSVAPRREHSALHTRPMADSPPAPDQPTGTREPRFSDRPLVRDAVYAVLFMFPAAAIVTLVYRFRIPMGGYAQGPAGVWDAMLATVFYGLVGGFVVVPLVAAIASHLLRRGQPRNPSRRGAIAAVGAALLYALVIAAL